MQPQEQEILNRLAVHLQERFAGEGSGHDWFHIERVWKVAGYLAQREGGNVFRVQAAALLHDIADWKFHGGDLSEGPRRAQLLLEKEGIAAAESEAICRIISEVSFKGAKVKDQVSSLESQIVQDADRLDALGAIGIARCFAYGGHQGAPIYDPAIKPQLHESAAAYYSAKTHSINHFYEKLLLLKDRLHTRAARELAAKRHAFLEEFLAQFLSEWNFADPMAR